jgi:hypothetical protein
MMAGSQMISMQIAATDAGPDGQIGRHGGLSGANYRSWRRAEIQQEIPGLSGDDNVNFHVSRLNR